MKVCARKTNPPKGAAPKRRGWLYLLCLLAVIAALLLWMYRDVSPVVRAEYGEGMPPATAFSQTEGAEYRSDADLADKGAHPILLRVGHRTVPCLLIVEDTFAPTADRRHLTFPSGYTPAPVEFITGLRDADIVGVSFEQDYDFSEAGEQEIHILLEDSSGNRTKIRATATVYAVVDQVIVEAGSPAPVSDAFCVEGFHGTLLTEITDAMLHTPGSYPMDIQCSENGRIFSSRLMVQDTVAPVAEGRTLMLSPEEAATAEDFLTEVTDETALTYSFITAPDPSRRDMQDILIRVTDAGGNYMDVPAQAFYSSIGAVTVEMKDAPLTPEELGLSGYTVEDFRVDVPGTYPVRVYDEAGQEQLVLVTLMDTVPPTLSAKTGLFYTKHPLPPEELVAVSDMSEVSLQYVTEPNWDSPGEQSFQVKAIDAAGNESVAAFEVSLAQDHTPPLLYGVIDRIGYVDEPILYLKEAYAEDDVDGRLELTVDSQVIPSQAGKYAVTYTATDKSGNSVSKSCTYTLVVPSVSEEQLIALTDAAIKKIIKPDMVKAEKLKAVFTYVQKQIRYVGTSDKTDWRKEAVRGFTKGKGDCFTFYAVTRALLDRLEIPYMSVKRLGGRTQHFWLIVNIGTGWYHFDTLKNPSLPSKCFMWNNSQLQLMPHFWQYDQENYPPIATQIFNYKAVVQMEREGRLP